MALLLVESGSMAPMLVEAPPFDEQAAERIIPS
jgi:hypothetical protein